MAEQKTLTDVVGSSVANWVRDPATGKERTPEEIIAAVTNAVLAEKNLARGVSLDPITGKPRASTDQQMVDAALAQLAANAKFEGSRYLPASQVAQTFARGGSRGVGVSALVNRPDLWALGKENVGKIIDRKNFDDPTSVKRFVVDPTTNQLTPEQLKQFNQIGAGGGMAIDPVTGGQVSIDSQGRYTLGEQPSGDVTGLDFSTYQGGYTPPAFNPLRLGGAPEGESIVSEVKNSNGTKTVTYSNGTTQTFSADGTPLGGDLENPAFSIVGGILKNYDMKGVADAIAKIRRDYPEIASDDILALLKFDTRYNASYLERFSGNAELIKKGLPTLSDEAYLKVEKQYEKIFKSYDVGSLASRQMYAKLIGNSMDAVDVTGRLKIGYERLKADKNIETAFRQFYPSLSDGDIVAAMLNPDEMLPALERKAAAAEIGGSYLAQGLKTSQTSAESLAAYGIDKVGAQAGVRYIAQALPRGQFLSEISKETGINYTQQTAEDITFKKSVKAQREEELLKAKEAARFGGSAGLMGSKALASQQRGAGLI